MTLFHLLGQTSRTLAPSHLLPRTLLPPWKEAQSRLLKVRRPHGEKNLMEEIQGTYATAGITEAILDPPAPVKPLQPTPHGAEMSHSCWRETCPNCQPTKSWAIKRLFWTPKFWGWFGTQQWITETSGLFKCFLSWSWWCHFQVNPNQSWAIRNDISEPHTLSVAWLPTGLETAPNTCAGKLSGEPEAATKSSPFAKLTSSFFNFPGKMRSGGRERKKRHRCSPISKFQWGFCVCANFPF